MKTLIFDSDITGHHLEYIHHIYAYASQIQKDFVFILPKEYENVKEKFEWPSATNIVFEYLTAEEVRLCKTPNLLIAAWHKSKIVKAAIKRYKADSVILIMLMQLMPFLPLWLPNKVKVTGIIYRIYFYEGSSIRGIRLWLEKLRYRIMVSNKSIEKLFVLNDQLAVNKLNNLYNTDKFHYIPDPIPEINDKKIHSIRHELRALKTDRIYLHFGGLDRRKGTLEILKAINAMSTEELVGKVFVFAGKVGKDIRSEFYDIVGQCVSKAQVIVFDEFCSYEHLYNLCYSCDFILIPYENYNQSSGVIGYASKFRKPVIGPSKGLIGYLIKEFHLGYADSDMRATNLRKILSSELSIRCSADYAKQHTIAEFCRKLIL